MVPSWTGVSRWPYIVLLALLYTLLNACKPLTIDDTAHYYYAAQLAAHPLDPYGFNVFWYEEPEPANHVLTPLVADYWWALGQRLFGAQPVLWKLWLWPFALLFVGALAALARRFAPGWEGTLVAMTVLSPTFLPSLNLMVDVPALALSLTALVIFLHAADHRSYAGAAAAGLVAALAMQTKYTGFLAPAVMLLYAILFGTLPLGLVAASTAAVLFGAWEGVIAGLYGESHFLYHLRAASTIQSTKYVLAIPLLCILGALAPGTALLGLAGLRVPRRWLAAAAGFWLLAYLLVAFVPDQFATYDCCRGPYGEPVTLGDLLFGAGGILVLAVAGAVLGRLCRGSQPTRWRNYRTEWFLLGWFLLEGAGYFALSPFPAARRVMGLVVVMTFATGRLASWSCRSGTRKRFVQVIALGTILLGFGFYGVDLQDALTEKAAVEQARALLPPRVDATVWYVGHWGFQFYAEQAGMQPIVPEESRLHRGDWLVLPDARIDQQTVELQENAVELRGTCVLADLLPLRTVSCYYGGRTPLQHQEGARLTVRIYRVMADFTPTRQRERFP